MAAFEYRQAQEVDGAFKRYQVRYLFIVKSGAILLGYPDTTQDADLFVEKNPANGERLVKCAIDVIPAPRIEPIGCADYPASISFANAPIRMNSSRPEGF
jgi:hypothetical protein